MGTLALPAGWPSVQMYHDINAQVKPRADADAGVARSFSQEMQTQQVQIHQHAKDTELVLLTPAFEAILQGVHEDDEDATQQIYSLFYTQAVIRKVYPEGGPLAKMIERCLNNVVNKGKLHNVENKLNPYDKKI